MELKPLTFKDAISEISRKFGRDMAALEALRVPDEKKQDIREQQERIVAERTIIQPPETKPVGYTEKDRHLIRVALMNHLRDIGFQFILSNFEYRGDVMDIFCMVNDRVYEFVIIMNHEDLEKELAKTYAHGSSPVKKYDQLARGKALPHFVLFVLPEFLYPVETVPFYAGIIRFWWRPKSITPKFVRLRDAQMRYRDFIKPATYRTVAERFERRNEAIIAKYDRSAFKKLHPEIEKELYELVE